MTTAPAIPLCPTPDAHPATCPCPRRTGETYYGQLIDTTRDISSYRDEQHVTDDTDDPQFFIRPAGGDFTQVTEEELLAAGPDRTIPDAASQSRTTADNPAASGDAADNPTVVTVTVHAPDAANASRWAGSIADLVRAEFGDSMRLDITVANHRNDHLPERAQAAIRALEQQVAVRDEQLATLRAELDRLRPATAATTDTEE